MKNKPIISLQDNDDSEDSDTFEFNYTAHSKFDEKFTKQVMDVDNPFAVPGTQLGGLIMSDSDEDFEEDANNNNHNQQNKSAEINDLVRSESHQKEGPIDVDEIHLGVSPEEIAKKSYQVWRNLCEILTKKLMGGEQSKFKNELRTQLYLDPLIVISIAEKIPLLQPICWVMKKQLVSSTQNIPVERKFKDPKFIIGNHSHRYNLETVEQIQHINEKQLNDELNHYRETMFDETPFWVLETMRITDIIRALPNIHALKELEQEAKERIEQLKLKDKWWRRTRNNAGNVNLID